MTGSGSSDLRALVFYGMDFEFWKVRIVTIVWDLETVKDCHQPKKTYVANYLNHVQNNTRMLYACHKAYVQENSGVWHLDSGCSNHMTSTESLLINIDMSIRCKVKMGTWDLVDSIGKGTLVVETKRGTRYIPKVMIIPDLDENILSVGQMVEYGYWLVFGDFMACIFGDRELQNHVATVQMTGNRCFPLMFESVDHIVANKVTIERNTWKWRRRFRHLNYDSLRMLQERCMVYGEECITGVHSNVSNAVNMESEIQLTETYDNTPKKWRNLNEVFAQCRLSVIDPENYNKAFQDEAWKKAMNDEITMIEKNARLVAKGYTQKPVIDFNETFAPVARLDTIRTLIALAAQKGCKLFQLDVKSYFLNGILKEEVYIDQPNGYLVKGKEHKNCKPISIPLLPTDKLRKNDGSEAVDEELYRRIVGSLLYLTATMPDIMYSACVLTKYMHCPSTKHLGTAKRILRYMQGTVDYGIKYKKGNAALLIGFCDSD
nr:uncharacterized protein LOC103431893 [Malus domestica]